ncbi:long-chain fatty acid--CoA ligase, partial [Streptomyces cavourensis]
MMDTDATVTAAGARLWAQPDWAERPAILAADDVLTYGDLHRRVGAAAHALHAAGVRAGDYVAVAMERSPAQLVAILGLMAAGACPCPLEPRLSHEETARRVAAVGLAWMLFDDAHAATAQASGLAQARLLPAREQARGDAAWPR